MLNFNSVVSQVPSTSLDLQQFIALRKEDIGTSIQEYFKRTNEAAGISTEKKLAAAAAAINATSAGYNETTAVGMSQRYQDGGE